MKIFGWNLERRSVDVGTALEQRADDGGQASTYTTQRLATIYLQAQGGGAVDVRQLAVSKYAGDLYGRCLAAATWSPGSPYLTPSLLYAIGQRLISHGRYLAVIRVTGNGMVTLQEPAQVHTYGGDPRPETWSYKCDFPAPSGGLVPHWATPEELVLIDWATGSPNEPWRSVGPLESVTARLQANLAASLAAEAGMAQGQILPVPTSGDSDDDSKDLHDALKKARGNTAVIDVEAVQWGATGGTGRGSMKPERFGSAFDPQAPIVNEQAERGVLASCGIPAALYLPSDGTSAREALRQFLHLSLTPLAKIIAGELSDKLDLPGLESSFDSLYAADVAGKARAYAGLVKGGVEVEEALRIVGLD